MLNPQIGERERGVNFSMLMTVIPVNFVVVQTLTVIGKVTPLVNAVLIFIQEHAIQSNITPIQFVLIKIINSKI